MNIKHRLNIWSYSTARKTRSFFPRRFINRRSRFPDTFPGNAKMEQENAGKTKEECPPTFFYRSSQLFHLFRLDLLIFFCFSSRSVDYGS
ncbi:hypothetical protein CEXT_634951 [Caerostris extrusa]|uniref:Uncharacterized protein n=1 Tax=Caerostris extrusa TaxID=172846 RepID=A0AAV4WIL6_CAEEX|nr:hypothetical protein CEXT_634951 [Caerostris extrusa]